MNKLKGIIFNCQRFSLQDGPGIRTTIFLKGCPLRCLWCSNPESQSFSTEIAHNDVLCNQCGECINVCPTNAISLKAKGISINRNQCNNCGSCVNVCYFGALKIFGEEKTIPQLITEIAKDIAYYRNSGGGVTLSGGEPLAQPDFAIELLRRCHDFGVHTAIDTCGYVNFDAFIEIIKFCDLILYDIKQTDTIIHKKFTGVDNNIILNNLEKVLYNGARVIIRIPVIPGANNTEENISSICKELIKFNTITEINLLPYHRLGIHKYKMLDRQYMMHNVTSSSMEKIDKLKNIIDGFGLECKILMS